MNNIVKTAQSLLGKTKYVFGANNPKTLEFDCSSFTQYVFKRNGYRLGRTTSEQVMQGIDVDKNNLKSGDLIFFQNTYRKGVSHVGIYTNNHKFIHCSSSKKTTVESDLNSNYYIEHYMKSKRIISENETNNNKPPNKDSEKPNNSSDSNDSIDSSDSSDSSDSINDSNSSIDEEKPTDLKWWGDVVVVVIVGMLIILTTIFTLNAFGLPNINIKNLISN